MSTIAYPMPREPRHRFPSPECTSADLTNIVGHKTVEKTVSCHISNDFNFFYRPFMLLVAICFRLDINCNDTEIEFFFNIACPIKLSFCCWKQKWSEASTESRKLRKTARRRRSIRKQKCRNQESHRIPWKRVLVYITAAAAYQIGFVSQEWTNNRS